MKTPLCSVCQESNDDLCSGCSQKVEDGDLEEIAVEVSRFLNGLTGSIGTLKDVEIKEVKRATDAIVIITAEGDGPKVVGKNGQVVKKLAEEFDSSIRVVEDSEDSEEVIRNLLEPVEVESINTVYKPDGTEKKVVVSEDNRRRVPISEDDFEEIVKTLTGKTFTLSFE